MKTGQIILPTSQPLGPGDYDVYTSDGVPLAQQEQVSRGKATYWAENNFDLWTTNTNTENHSAPISSIQNGFLLQSSIHQLFNDYSISVNSDDNYKITCFIPDDFGLDGRILDPRDRFKLNGSKWNFQLDYGVGNETRT
ncbi:hypothetical protein DTO212C5_842 [Paecilomyces variotii]|nr:hypothetical protein DTO212C5_842 [Paecilomyces variotii]